MNINQCERLAKDAMFAGAKPEDISFTLVGPKGRLECVWLDPYMGIFARKNNTKEGFFMVGDFEMVVGLEVEDYTVKVDGN